MVAFKAKQNRQQILIHKRELSLTKIIDTKFFLRRKRKNKHLIAIKKGKNKQNGQFNLKAK